MKKNLLIILALSFTALSSVQAQKISTVVGKYFSGVHSGDGGPATNAGLDHPFGVAIDSRGNLYVSEYMYYIRKIDQNGIITTIAGNGNIPGPLGDGGPPLQHISIWSLIWPWMHRTISISLITAIAVYVR